MNRVLKPQNRIARPIRKWLFAIRSSSPPQRLLLGAAASTRAPVLQRGGRVDGIVTLTFVGRSEFTADMLCRSRNTLTACLLTPDVESLARIAR
jgi:hypothetical protein